MNRDEFIEKYGDIEVMFSHYYKYSFTYTAVISDGVTLSVSFGGCADAIYRDEVCNNDTQKVKSLDPYSGSVHENGKEIEGFYDF